MAFSDQGRTGKGNARGMGKGFKQVVPQIAGLGTMGFIHQNQNTLRIIHRAKQTIFGWCFIEMFIVLMQSQNI